jgi:transposase
VQRGWFLIGDKKKVETPKKKESKTIIGGLCLKTRKIYRKKTDKGTSQTFIGFLYQLKRSFPDVLIILISDNSSIHTSKKVEAFLKRNPLIKIRFLTPYSPEYNPIERFRLWLKKKVYGSRSYQSVNEVISKIRKFIWHYHKNRLVDSVNFNLKPYAEIL